MTNGLSAEDGGRDGSETFSWRLIVYLLLFFIYGFPCFNPRMARIDYGFCCLLTAFTHSHLFTLFLNFRKYSSIFIVATDFANGIITIIIWIMIMTTMLAA